MSQKNYTLLEKVTGMVSCRLLILLCTCFVTSAKAQVIITEIMHGNINCVYDEEKNPESWIEIYNPTDEVVLLGEYRLGSSIKYEESLDLHHIWYILPLCYLTITCDDNSGNARMNLDTDGGNIYIFDEKGGIVDSLEYPKMIKPDVSWGLDLADSTWGTMLRATPGKPNSTIAEKNPHKVNFSADGGIWEHIDPFYVELSAKEVPDYYSEQQPIDSSLCIRYTLDGSEPTDSSSIYSEPIYVDKTTIIRAKVFDESKPLLPSNSVSYINHGRPVDKNVVSIITDSLYFWDEELGIMGNRISAALGYRRPMNFEYFPINPEFQSENLLCKGRAGGNTSRMGDPYINLVLNAKKRYGEKHFKSTFWPHLKPNIKENKSIYLRCGNKKLGFMRDAVSLTMASYLDLDYQAVDALSVYLNGEYYGFLYMYERSNDDYIWSNYNKLENFDLISIEGNQNPVVKSGTIDEFNKLVEFWQSAPHSLDEWRKMIDVEEYTNLMALELFSGNRDFWYNNTRLFKNRDDSSSVWRWIANDFDNTFISFLDNSYFEWGLSDEVDGLHKSDDYGSQLWRAILESDEYKSYFLDRIIAYHGDFLNNRIYNACVDSIYELVKDEIKLTKALRMDGGSGNWHYNYLKECIEKRSDYFHADLQSFFHLGSPVSVNVKEIPEDSVILFYNNVELKTKSFDGWDFAGRTFTVQAKEGNDLTDKNYNWIVERTRGNSVETETYANQKMFSLVIPSDVDRIVVTPVATRGVGSVENVKSLTDLELFRRDHDVIVWDLYGRQIYCSDRNQNLVLPKKVPLIISSEGRVKKVMF